MIRTYQDVLEIEKRPLPVDGITCTYSFIRKTALEFPDLPALSYFPRIEDHAAPVRWTYSELLADITRAANLFRQLGVQRGDIVACITPNLPETHIAIWGAETAGIAFAINPLLEGSQLAELLRAAKASWIVTTGPALDLEIWQRVAQAVAHVPNIQGVLAINAPPYSQLLGGSTALPTELNGLPVLDFNRVLASSMAHQLDFLPPLLTDIASYFCTGGTTGLPKIACHSHYNEVALCLQLNAVAGEQMLAPGRTVLTALPLFHVNALLGTGLAVFAQGGHVLLAPPGGFRSPGLIQRFWEIVETHRVNAYSAVPTVYASLLQVPTDGYDTSSLKLALCGAAPMPVELFRKFEQQSGLRILEGYGLTEGTCVSSINPAEGEARIGSIGMRVPWQDMRAMILDEQGGWLRDAEVDEVGAICISGPNVFVGYLDATHSLGMWFETCAPDGEIKRWFNTGDLGRRDADGYFWLAGRKKELIIRGGHNIDPKSIEEVLAKHPAVAMCAAVGRPDAHSGEVPVAYVQLRAGSVAGEAELLAFAADHINERASVPKSVQLLETLPLTGVGKIFKPALVMRETEFVVRQEARTLGVVLDELMVEQAPKLGLIVRYRVANGGDLLADVLGRYTFATQPL